MKHRLTLFTLLVSLLLTSSTALTSSSISASEIGFRGSKVWVEPLRQRRSIFFFNILHRPLNALAIITILAKLSKEMKTVELLFTKMIEVKTRAAFPNEQWQNCFLAKWTRRFWIDRPGQRGPTYSAHAQSQRNSIVGVCTTHFSCSCKVNRYINWPKMATTLSFEAELARLKVSKEAYVNVYRRGDVCV